MGGGVIENQKVTSSLLRGICSQWYTKNSVSESLGNIRRKLSPASVNGANLPYLKPKGQIGHCTTGVQSHLVCSLYLFLVCSPLQEPLKVLGNNIPSVWKKLQSPRASEADFKTSGHQDFLVSHDIQCYLTTFTKHALALPPPCF